MIGDTTNFCPFIQASSEWPFSELFFCDVLLWNQYNCIPFNIFSCRILTISNRLKCYPTNTPRGFHVETTWKRPFPRRFNVEPAWSVCRVILTGISMQKKKKRINHMCNIISEHSNILPIKFEKNWERAWIQNETFRVDISL